MKKMKYFCIVFILSIIVFSSINCYAACSHTYVTTSKAFKKVSTSSTCTQHTLKQECKKCGAKRTLLGTPDKTHNYKVVTHKSPTCTNTGSIKFTCKDCNYGYTKTTSKLGHSYVNLGNTTEKVAKVGLCMRVVKKEKCSRCSNVQTTVVSKDNSHDYKCTIKTSPTCSKNGSALYECKTCKYKYTKVMTATGHTFVDVGVKLEKVCTKPICTNTYQLSKCTKCSQTNQKLIATDKAHDYKNNVCKTCGLKLDTIFNPNSSEQTKALQTHLKKLGYYTGSVDGKIGKGTISAINSLLNDQNSSLKRLSSDASWNDISNNMNKFIMGVSETKTQANARIKKEASKEVKKNLNDKTSILNDKEEKAFDKAITEVLTHDTTYNMSAGARDEGFNTYTKYLNNKTEEPQKSVQFDCSSFASLVVSQSTGVACKRSDGVTPYSTADFLNDKVNFSGGDKPKTEINVKDLEKGQLILCIDDNGTDHIMVYMGNETIVHSNNTYDGVTMNKLDKDDEYTKQFLSTKDGDFDKIYILTPDAKPKE